MTPFGAWPIRAMRAFSKPSTGCWPIARSCRSGADDPCLQDRADGPENPGALAHHTGARAAELAALQPLAAPVADFRTRLLEHVEQEAAKLPAGVTWLASSDIIESVFGQYKTFTARGPLKEVGRLVLLIPAFLSELTAPAIREAMTIGAQHRCRAVGRDPSRAVHARTPPTRPQTRHENCMNASRGYGGKLNSLSSAIDRRSD
jgi:hypothetical protein